MTGSRRVLYTGTREPEIVPTGLELVHMPVLRTEYMLVPGEEEELVGLLEQPHQLLLFSRHAIAALLHANLSTAHTTRIWCVGKKTAERAREAWSARQIATPSKNHQHYQGVINAICEDADHSPLIVAGLESARRPVRDDLERCLGDAAPVVHHVDAYRTLVREDVREAFARARGEELDWIVFASPRAVAALAPYLDGSKARLAAIGQTTARAIEESGRVCDLVASTPSTRVLLEEIVAIRATVKSDRDGSESAD